VKCEITQVGECFRRELPKHQRLAEAISECLRPKSAPLACALGLSVALATVAPVQAATYTVTNLNDAGSGSLRAAIIAADSHLGPDSIVFSSGVSGTITLASGPLQHGHNNWDYEDANGDLIITGPGKETLAINGNGGSAVLEAWLFGDDSSLTLSGVTLRNADVGLLISGRFHETTLTTIEDCIITGTSRAGIEIEALDYSGGSFLLRNLVISGNGATGVFNNGGDTVITGSVIADNGGIGIGTGSIMHASWPITVEDTLIARNALGGMDCGGFTVAFVGGTQIINNGRVGLGCNAEVTRSTVTGNRGGGISAYHIEIQDSTVSGNTRDSGGGISIGGGRYNLGGHLVVINSTISGNEAQERGGGIYQFSGSTVIENSTITGNQAATGGGLFKHFYNELFDDEVAVEPTGIRNSIIAGNEATSNPDTRIGAPFAWSVIEPADVSYTLIGDPGDAYITDTVPGSNVFGEYPLLGPLQDNGGPTLTHALLPGSQARDSGDPSFLPLLANDQRGAGFSRVVNGRIDMGAFEVQGGVKAAVGVWRPSTRQFLLDANGNGRWDGTRGDILTSPFGLSTDLPVTGDWNRDGTDEVGFWRPSTRQFYLDANGNGLWDGTRGDILTSPFGLSTDRPVTGDWNGDGTDDVGFWRPSTRQFYLDANGNRRWDGTIGGDVLTSAFGLKTDSPLAGDWDGDGTDEIGFWRPSTRQFYLDANGNGRWDGTRGDILTSAFGVASDRPVVGDWNADDADDVGVWQTGSYQFLLDANGNDRWDGTTGGDTLTVSFGTAADVPLAGRW